MLGYPGEVRLGDEGDTGFASWADGSKGGCGLPRHVTGTWDPARPCIGVHPSQHAAAPCPATLMPGSG